MSAEMGIGIDQLGKVQVGLNKKILQGVKIQIVGVKNAGGLEHHLFTIPLVG